MPEYTPLLPLVQNSTFDYKALTEVLWEIRALSYSNLYQAQKSLADIERVDMVLSDYFRESDYRYTFGVDVEFIPISQRRAYRKSTFYKKDFNITSIITNPDIFTKVPLVFINGELFTNINIFVNEELTSVVIKIQDTSTGATRDGFTRTEFQSLIDNGNTMTVFFVPNTKSLTRSNVNMQTIRNYTFVPEYLGMPIDDNFISRNDINADDVFIPFMTTHNNRPFQYRILDATTSNNKLYFSGSQINTFTNTMANISLVYLQNHLMKITVPAGDEYFSVPLQDTPVPVENMMVFKKTNHSYYLDHTAVIDIHYPNIYKLTRDHGDDVVIYVYYCDNVDSLRSNHANELDLYYRFTNNVLEKYKDGTIPEIIRDYAPITVNYSIEDFESLDPRINYLQYKIDRFKELISQNGDYHRRYLEKIIGSNGFFFDISTIDLSTRIRNDNHSEITELSGREEFLEPHYLFIFVHHGNNDKIVTFLDNYHIYPKEYRDGRHIYVYVPTRLVNANSIIEIERMYDKTLRRSITFTGDTTTPVFTLPNTEGFIPENLYVSYLNPVGDEIYMPIEDYTISTTYPVFNINDIETYRSRGNITVTITNAAHAHKTIYLNASLVNFVTEPVNQMRFDINRRIGTDMTHVRIFKNGRLINHLANSIMFSEYCNGPHNVRPQAFFEGDDVFSCVYSSDRREHVYTQNEVDVSGLVNLTGILDRPINLRWYDIYLNGLKLTSNNIDILSPYIIQLKNVPTRRYLLIYRRNIDVSPFTITSSDIGNDLVNALPDLVQAIDDYYPDLPDDLSDTTNDLIVDYVAFLERFLPTIGLINPDIQQVTDTMLSSISGIADENMNIFINPDRQDIFYSNDIMMNPDYQDSFLPIIDP